MEEHNGREKPTQRKLEDVIEEYPSTGNGKPDVDRVAQQENDIFNLKKNRYRTDTRSRHVLGWVNVAIIVCWLVAVLVIMFLERPLSDTVLCVLLGTTTANVIGLAAIVYRGYFVNMSQDIDFSHYEHELDKNKKGN